MGMILTPEAAREIVSVNRLAKKPHTRIHLLLAILLSLLFTAAMAVVGFHAYVAWLLGRPVIAPLSSNPMEAIGVPYEDVRFHSSNNRTTLDGWYLPYAGSAKTIVFSHGYGANREESWVPMYDLAKAAHMQKYNVLMFDYGFVHPEQVVTGGVQETYELLGAIDLAKQKGASQVFVWGFSMGAGTALNAALQGADIAGMILDSTFVLSPDTLYHNIREHADLPRFPSLNLIRFFFPLMNGVSLKQVPYEKMTETSFNFPIFLIHGKKDDKAPFQLAQEIFANQQNEPLSKLWLLPNGHHELIYSVYKKDYLGKTLSFLDTVSALEKPAIAAAP
ncbi:alpha/beta hydrolase [Gorillibacterium sp. sgz5001074]|uniref:alpha/beta hydrolase n=1 Tax=Gorillibacterium sp. sgz5001074 TaxID=3446695 RepID=UPI003F664717